MRYINLRFTYLLTYLHHDAKSRSYWVCVQYHRLKHVGGKTCQLTTNTELRPTSGPKFFVLYVLM